MSQGQGWSPLAEFRRRKPMLEKTKKAISRALKSRNRKPRTAGGVAKSVGGAISGAVLGRTRAGTRVRTAGLIAAGLGAGKVVMSYQDRARDRALEGVKKTIKVMDNQDKDDYRTMDRTIEGLFVNTALGMKGVDLAKMQADADRRRERRNNLMRRIADPERSTVKQLVKEDIQKIKQRFSQKKGVAKYSSEGPSLAEFRRGRKQTASTRRKIAETLKRKLRSREQRAKDDAVATKGREAHARGRAAMVGGLAGAALGSRLGASVPNASPRRWGSASSSELPSLNAALAAGDTLARREENHWKARSSIAGAALGGLVGYAGTSMATSLAQKRRRKRKVEDE